MLRRHLGARFGRLNRGGKLGAVKTLVLAAFLCCVPVARATPATFCASIAPVAQIDPVALNLLARMSWKYRHLRSYETYIARRFSNESIDAPVIRRFRVDRGAFVWSELTPDKQWRKFIYGFPEISIAYDSRFPKRYVRRDLIYSGPGDMQRVRSVLSGWDIDQYLLLLVLSGEWPAQLLVNPELQSLSIARENNLEIVALSFDDSLLARDNAARVTHNKTTLRFAIDPETLLLARIESIDGETPKTVTTVESYPGARFDPDFDQTIFSSAAPLDYRLIKRFGPQRRKY